MSKFYSTALIAAWFVLLAPVQPVQAADAKSAVTNLAEVDEDFSSQGEYSGWVLSTSHCWQSNGLQVIAMGEGQFDAVMYPGGLPGNGFYGGETTRFQGQKTDDTVHLTTEGFQLSIANGQGPTVSQ